MAIAQVKAVLNGTEYILNYDSGSGQYKATLTAPGLTSRNQSGGYYNVSVTATNTAGTSGSADGTTLSGLRLVVREKIAPVITIVSPSNGAYVINNKQPVVIRIVDEVNGSGVDTSSVSVKLDGTAVAASTLSRTSITNGYQYTYTPSSALTDGSNTITVNASDLDGNAASAASTTFIVDTVPPSLNVSHPPEGLITAQKSLTLAGTSNDVTSSPVTVNIKLNGRDLGNAAVSSGGAFTFPMTLAEGENTITVRSTDAAGKYSEVTRHVVLDTSCPVVRLASITPNPVDAGDTVIIAVTIAEE